MDTTALGTWRNPPLAYVVAELVISPYYSMAPKVPGLQDQLRKAFPRTVEARELHVEGDKAVSQPLWRLLSADQTRGVQLGSRAISLHATSYKNSKDFLARWAEVLDAVTAADLGAFVERAGLRYVDLIVPTDDSAPADYLAPSLQGITPDGARSTGSMWAAAYQFDGSIVNLKVAAPTPTGLLLPPDFNALPLAKPKVMHDAEECLKDGRAIGFMDAACGREINRLFDASELKGIYDEMQKLTSQTFRAAMSSKARAEWV